MLTRTEAVQRQPTIRSAAPERKRGAFAASRRGRRPKPRFPAQLEPAVAARGCTTQWLVLSLRDGPRQVTSPATAPAVPVRCVPVSLPGRRNLIGEPQSLHAAEDRVGSARRQTAHTLGTLIRVVPIDLSPAEKERSRSFPIISLVSHGSPFLHLLSRSASARRARCKWLFTVPSGRSSMCATSSTLRS